MPHPATLSKRERQIMDVLYRRGSATVAEVRRRLADAPSYSAVRTILRILEDKGHVRHHRDGLRYVYTPTIAAEKARRSALKHIIDTFFAGSPSRLMAALVELSRGEIDETELATLRQMIDDARKKGR
jgi:predicted transcriptional regulator